MTSQPHSAPARWRLDLPRPPDGSPQYVWVTPRLELAIFRHDGRVHAFTSICPHMGAQLSVDLTRRCLHCPWHGLAAPLAGWMKRQLARHAGRQLAEDEPFRARRAELARRGIDLPFAIFAQATELESLTSRIQESLASPVRADGRAADR
jgi:hypothetical protein